MEDSGWIVDKWSNNVNLEKNQLVPAKHKFRGIGIPMALGTGFPDFITFKKTKDSYEGVIGVECKTGKYLDKTEKEKCRWLLDNNVFSKILIAYKTKEGNKIKINYMEFK